MSATPLLELRNVTKVFQSGIRKTPATTTVALRDASLVLPDGTATATAIANMVTTSTTHCTNWVQVTACMPPRKEHSKMPPSAMKTPNSNVSPDNMDVTKPMP